MYNWTRKIFKSSNRAEKPVEKYEKVYDLGWIGESQPLHKCRHTETGQYVAMKTLPLKSTTEIGVPIMTVRRISLLKEIDHPNIASMIEMIYKETDSYVDVALGYNDVDLRMFMFWDYTGSTDPWVIRNVLLQILRGVYCYHSIHVAHGNLNPQNVLIDVDNYNVTITDLDIIVTPSYLAPEILKDPSLDDVEISMKADVFAIGCLFAEMLMRKPLFEGRSEFEESVAISKLVGDIEKYSEEDEDKLTLTLLKRLPDLGLPGIDLLSRMIRPHPRDRISVEEALNHPYFGLLFLH